MNNFVKRGFILRDRIILLNDDAKSAINTQALLEKLQIRETEAVRAMMVPPDGKWWVHPERWEINIDQKDFPDWYTKDTERYELEFFYSVRQWWSSHVFVDQRIEELSDGIYWLKGCDVDSLTGNVHVFCDNCIINSMWDNATIELLCNNSKVGRMMEDSKIKKVSDKSEVLEMREHSLVQTLTDDARIEKMCDNSIIHCLEENAMVEKISQEAIVCRMSDNSKVVSADGSSKILIMLHNSKVEEMADKAMVCNMGCNQVIAPKMKDNSIVLFSNGVALISPDKQQENTEPDMDEEPELD